MIERRRGSIVNIIGLGGKAASTMHLSGGAANAALMLVTAGCANALGKYGIRVNAVNPGNTLTERLQEALRLDAQKQGITEAEVESAWKRFSATYFLQHSPEEVAWHTRLLAERDPGSDEPVVALDPRSVRGTTAVLIFAHGPESRFRAECSTGRTGSGERFHPREICAFPQHDLETGMCAPWRPANPGCRQESRPRRSHLQRRRRGCDGGRFRGY